MAGIISMGLGSGLDINGLVSKLVVAERAPTAGRLDRQEAAIQAKISAFGNFKSALSVFRDSFASLKELSTFQKVTATSSDTAVISTSALSNADIGNYRLESKQLAQSHTLVSPVFDAADAVVGTGTVTIKFGVTDFDAMSNTYNGFSQNAEKGTLTLTIDPTNNTVTGIRDAINKAKAGVTAAAIYDGRGYRLVLNSTDSGANNAMQVTAVSGDGLSALDFNATSRNMSQTQQAQDAVVSINGLDVTSASNTVGGALKGLTLSLQQAQPGKIVNVDVGQGNGDIVKAIEYFVKSYNDLVTAVKNVASYNAESKTGGVLLGDSAVQGAVSQLASEMGRFVEGLSGSVRGLVDLGIRKKADGTLNLNSVQLNAALTADRDSVAAVFAMIGRTTDDGVHYLGGGSNTCVGQYGVHVTQAATQGKFTSQQGITFPLVIDSTNKVFRINVDGVQSGDIVLTEGSYLNGSALTAEMQSRINGDSALKAGGAAITVTLDNANHLVVASKSFGSASQVSITQANATLGLALGIGSTPGQDVDGTIGGQTAEGKGQQLTATTGDANGLSILIPDRKVGARGTINFSRGLMERLDKVMGSFLDQKGSVASRTDGLQKSLDKIQGERQKLDDRMSRLEERLLAKFNAMDSLLGQLQSTSSYLTQQLKNLPYSNSNKEQ